LRRVDREIETETEMEMETETEIESAEMGRETFSAIRRGSFDESVAKRVEDVLET
jgi:hypothetical protein